MFKLTKLVKYLLLGGSIALLIFVLLNAVSLDLTKRGPSAVLAQNYWDNQDTGDDVYVEYPSDPAPEPATGGYQPPVQSNPVYTPPQSQSPKAPESQSPKAPESQSPQAPQAPVCQPAPREYNECIDNGASRRVWTDGCGTYNVIVGSQADAACGTVLQQCTGNPREYNECIGNGTSRRVRQDACGNYSVIVQSQGDMACSQGTPNPGPAPVVPTSNPTAPICEPGQVNLSVNPNSVNVGQALTFNVSGSQGSTWLDDQINGGVSNSGGFWGSRTLTANNPGTYTWTHYWRNTAPNRTDIVSDLCQKSVSFTINQPITPPPAQVLCPLTISTSSINVDQFATYTLNTSNAPAGATATWYGTNNGNAIAANPGFPVTLSNAYSGSQHGGPGSYTRYIQIISNGQVVCTSNTVNLTVNQPIVPPTPTPTPTPRPVVTPTPTPTPTPQVAATLKCPEGTIQTMENNTIICIQNVNTNNNVNNNQLSQVFNPVVNVPQPQAQTPQVVYAVAGQPTFYQATPSAEPKVAYVTPANVQSLPKTGLPLFGWTLGTLLPLGLRLRRIGKKDLGNSIANSVWQERQFQI